ncbi:hypothetical protein PO909_028620 [Leuciscus waleckii]
MFQSFSGVPVAPATNVSSQQNQWAPGPSFSTGPYSYHTNPNPGPYHSNQPSTCPWTQWKAGELDSSCLQRYYLSVPTDLWPLISVSPFLRLMGKHVSNRATMALNVVYHQGPSQNPQADVSESLLSHTD